MPLARFYFALALAVALSAPVAAENSKSPADSIWRVPDVGALPDDQPAQLIRRGLDLVTRSYALIGPQAADRADRFAGNNLSCGDCHLDAGTRKFGLPLFGLYGDFPLYSFRRGDEISIQDRINSCMTRSLNGRPLPDDSPQMAALVAYIKFLSSDMTKDEQIAGGGAGDMPELNRAALPSRGKEIYAANCSACHRQDGGGLPRDPQALNLGFAAPPLWGDDSFNDGAGLARITNMANFVHSNMPAGADYLNPKISVEDAWDVAAYVESQPRPHKAGLKDDFPQLIYKPIDTPYGPYADGFDEAQHKYGPFAPIRAAIARLKAEQDETGHKQ